MVLENYFRHFEDVLTGRDERDLWPKKEDLKPGRIYIDQKSCLDVQSFLDEHRYCLVEGAERRGKTTLVRFIGLRYVEEWHVYQIDVSRISDTSDLDDFIYLLKGGFLDRSDTLMIVEDCHMKPEVAKKLLKTVEGCREASFLCTMRTVKQMGRIPVEEPFEDLKIRSQGWVVHLDETEEIIYNNIKGIVEKFLEIRSSDLKHKSTKATPTSDDYKYLVEQTGGNKRILNYYLEAWLNAKDPDLSLRQVDRKLILEQFRKERLKALTEVQLEVVLIMSALGQFEVPIVIRPLFPSSVSKLDFDRAADELNALKGLAFKLPRGAWLLADTESRLTLECYQKRIDNRFVYEILSTYVKEAFNYFEVFHALHRARERPMLVSLAEDAEVRNSLARRFGDPKTILSEMLYVLRAIAWVDKVKALDLWREYRKTLGEKFFDEIQRKLSEARDIRITTMLFTLLRTIDKEGEAVPLANALTVEFLLSQARAELSNLNYIQILVTRLHALAREKAKQLLNSLDESDYKKLGEKARKANFQQVMWFLRLLDAHLESEAAAEAFLEGLGLEVLLGMIRSSAFSVINGMVRYLDAVAPKRTKQVLNSLDESDYKKLGEKARQGSLQAVHWFLRCLAGDEELKGFADHFLKAIGQDALSQMASVSAINTIKKFRSLLGRLNTDTATEIRNSLKPALSDEDWIERWADETVGPQSRRLWGWARSLKPGLRERGKKLAKRLANADTALRFEEAKGATPVEKLGWLLFGAYYLDEEAAKSLVLKAVQVFDARSMRYSLEHLVFLLKNSRWCNPEAAQQLVEKIFSCDATSLSSKGELSWFCQLLWEAILSNESRTEQWVNEVSENFWEDLVVNASPSDTFHLLLILWQVNEEIGSRVTHAVGQRLLKSSNLLDDLHAIPLLGFFAFLGLEPQVTISFSPAEKVTELCIYPASKRLACSLFYLQESKPESIQDFIKAILAIRGMTPRMALLLAEHPLPWSALALTDILISAINESQIEREDVYDRMLLLFRTIRRRKIYVGTLLNEMCAPQFAQQRELTPETEDSIEREEEKTRSWAIIRLANAIDKGIFSMQKTKHPITHKASRLLNINMGHPQVTFAFDITENLLLALYDVQRDKGWADCNTWDADFRSSWKGEPLPPQQLRYWQGILLKMNMVKVDYKETHKGDWTIVFGVNINHPLVKSFIKA